MRSYYITDSNEKGNYSSSAYQVSPDFGNRLLAGFNNVNVFHVASSKTAPRKEIATQKSSRKKIKQIRNS